jgi:hypothetical protein
MSKMGRPSHKGNGVQKLRDEAPISTGEKAAGIVESTHQAEGSVNLAALVSNNIKGARDRHKRNNVNPEDALGIIKAALFQFQTSGGTVAIVRLPQRTPPSLGIVLSNADVCDKCGNFILGSGNNGRCSNCRKY